MPKLTYPQPGMKGPLWHRSMVEFVLGWHATRRSRKRISRISDEPALQIVSPDGMRPLSPEDIPLIFLCRNDRRFLPSFLAHYRQLGVTRFICVDDQSDDGTFEYLAAERDVDLWRSSLRYKEARRGKSWREGLFRIYGSGRWYLNVDSDEYLIYDRCFEMPLPALIARLEGLSIRRLAAPMIDMYPSGDMDAADFTGLDARKPWEVANCYDGEGYTIKRNARFMRIRGGVRKRLFGSDLDLMKYPLMFWDEHCSLGENIHQPLPYTRNFSPTLGVLMHFKFFSDYHQRIQDAVNGGQHFGGAREYKRMLERLDDNGPMTFDYAGSHRFTSPTQFVEQGFVAPLFT